MEGSSCVGAMNVGQSQTSQDATLMVQESGNGTLSAPLSSIHVPVVVQNENNHPPLALDNNNDDSDDEVQALNARLKSDIWDEFSRSRVGNEIKAKCKHCLKLLGGGAKCGTSHLRHHQKRGFKKKIHERKQAVFGSNYLAKDKKELAVCTFNSDVSKKELAIETNCPKYPTLGDIAKDLLAIPVSSVASESAFSSGGRLLDPHRSKLHYSTVEALMCTRTWIQDEFRRESEASTSANALEGCFSALSMNEIPAIPEAEIEEEQVAMTKTAMNYHFDDID